MKSINSEKETFVKRWNLKYLWKQSDANLNKIWFLRLAKIKISNNLHFVQDDGVSRSSYYNKNTINWVISKRQIIISHSSESRKVQDHGSSKFSAWWKLTYSLMASISLWPHKAEGPRELCEIFFIRELILFMSTPPRTSQSLHLLIPHWIVDFHI